MEYNPAKLTKEGRIKLRTFLIELLGREIVKTIYFIATITRLDLTLDVFNMEPNLYIYKLRAKQSQIYREDESNNISSQVIGSDSSNCRITMYNKNVEQGKASDTNHQRIEVRLRNLKTTMSDMKMLGEKLLKNIMELDFYHADFLTDDRFSKKFKRVARTEGLNSAINGVKDNRRRCYRRYLEKHCAYPITLDELNFEKVHRIALGSLLHPDFRNQQS